MPDLFDSPWKILIIAVVVIILFGSRKLPDAARSLGRSMRILKTEVSGLHDDEPEEGKASQGSFTQKELGAPAQPEDSQAKIEDLQKQLNDLKSANGEAPAETQQTR